MKTPGTLLFHLSLIITVPLLAANAAFAQGSLTPLAAPGMTMKALDQIASTAIQLDAVHTPGDGNYHFIISQPGSYYLAGNLTVVDEDNGIKVTAPGVTIDLNGFVLTRGAPTNSGAGIEIDSGADGCTIKNGTVHYFNAGIFCSAAALGAPGSSLIQITVAESSIVGIDCSSGTAWVLDRCRVYKSGFGISASPGSTLIHCIANANHGSGFSVGDGSTLVDCTSYNNVGASYGILTGNGCTLVHCTARGNIGSGAFGFGINAAAGSTLIGCTATANSSTNASPSGSTGGGIFAGEGSTVKDCSASGNKGDGVQVRDRCSIEGCTSTGNGSGTTGSGITADDGALISNCTAAKNKAYGIYAGNGASIIASVAQANVTTGGFGVGIRVGSDATVSGCTSSGNSADGIQMIDRSQIIQNTVAENGTGSTGEGIHSFFGTHNRIDSNQVQGNKGAGIHWGTTDIVVRNVSSGNGSAVNYSPASGTNMGPLSTPASATSPWANF